MNEYLENRFITAVVDNNATLLRYLFARNPDVEMHTLMHHLLLDLTVEYDCAKVATVLLVNKVFSFKELATSVLAQNKPHLLETLFFMPKNYAEKSDLNRICEDHYDTADAVTRSVIDVNRSTATNIDMTQYTNFRML